MAENSGDRQRWRNRMFLALNELKLRCDPRDAGCIVRLETLLSIQGWPFTEDRYLEVCKELGVRA